MKSLRLAYLRFRDEFRARLTRSMYARFMRRRAKARRTFLAIRVQPESKRQSVTEVRDGGLTRHWRESR